MNKDDERKWIHPLALDIINGIHYLHENYPDSGQKYILIENWDEAGGPLLTDRAKAVLAAVEKALEQCENCRGRLSFNSCNSGGVQISGETQECPLASIRRAWKGKK